MPRSFLDSQAQWFPEGSLADLPDIEADRSAWNILGWELSPGDAVFFHMLTLHASGGVGAIVGVVPSRYVSLAMTLLTHRASGKLRHSFPASKRNSPAVPK